MRLVSPATLATLDAAAAGDSCRAAVALSAGAVPPLRAASAAPASGPCPTATLDAAAAGDSTCRGSRAAAVGGSDAGDPVRARVAMDESMPEKFKFRARRMLVAKGR